MPAPFQERLADGKNGVEGVSFVRTTRNTSFKCASCQYATISFEREGNAPLRAYLIASDHGAVELGVASIQFQDDPVTSQRQSFDLGDDGLISRRRTERPFNDPENFERRSAVVSDQSGGTVCEASVGKAGVKALRDATGCLAFAPQLHHDPTLTRAPFRNHRRVAALPKAEGFGRRDPSRCEVKRCGRSTMPSEWEGLPEDFGCRENSGNGAGTFLAGKASEEA